MSDPRAVHDFARFAELIASELELQNVELLDTSGLYDDLALDSFAALHLLLYIEELAEVANPPIELPELYTLGDAYAYYWDLVGEL
jgi:acyl carrier protein